MKHLAGKAALTGLSKKRISEFTEQVINGWDYKVICEIVTGTE